MFVGQDDDLAPIFIRHGLLLGQIIQLGSRFGVISNVFLVLRVPTPPPPFPGISARPPLIGLDGGVTPNDVPILGLSYVSDDGGTTFTRRTDFNFRFSLRLALNRGSSMTMPATTIRGLHRLAVGESGAGQLGVVLITASPVCVPTPESRDARRRACVGRQDAGRDRPSSRSTLIR